MNDIKSGRGVFAPRPFTFKNLEGKDEVWSGRGRFSKTLQAALESEATKGVTTIKDALVAHKKNKPTGRPVGRPAKAKTEVASVATSDVKAMADAVIAKLTPEA